MIREKRKMITLPIAPLNKYLVFWKTKQEIFKRKKKSHTRERERERERERGFWVLKSKSLNIFSSSTRSFKPSVAAYKKRRENSDEQSKQRCLPFSDLRERKREADTVYVRACWERERERMSGRGGGGGGGGVNNNNGKGNTGISGIPAASRKMVQSLKEIVNCPEPEIYAMLKECNMDPNEAVNRLLSQGLFFCFFGSQWSLGIRFLLLDWQIFYCLGSWIWLWPI